MSIYYWRTYTRALIAVLKVPLLLGLFYRREFAHIVDCIVRARLIAMTEDVGTELVVSKF